VKKIFVAALLAGTAGCSSDPQADKAARQLATCAGRIQGMTQSKAMGFLPVAELGQMVSLAEIYGQTVAHYWSHGFADKLVYAWRVKPIMERERKAYTDKFDPKDEEGMGKAMMNCVQLDPIHLRLIAEFGGGK
jgi:hypothetical protein